MPFQSEAQRAYLYSQHPDIAKKWRAEAGPQPNLPVHKSAPLKGLKAASPAAKESKMSLSWLHKVAAIAPILLPLIPGLPPAVIPFIVKGITVGESIEGASGPEKLAKAVEEVNNGVAALNAVKPGTVDPSSVNDAVVHGISTVIAVANIAHPKDGSK